ncbi:MAG: hypothetical protein EA353_11975 [Puniceicoccaceae bacterium]|nr:MAG: hypothetical protein EA353_11975 [Puniceicoccaceae bacterium]
MDVWKKDPLQEATGILAYLFAVDEPVILENFDASLLIEWWTSKRADLISEILENWKLQSLDEASPIADRARKLFPELGQFDVGIQPEEEAGTFYVHIRPFLLSTLQVIQPVELPIACSHIEFTPPSDLVRHLRDARQFARECTVDPYRFANLIAAVFGATQSAMILTLGESAITQKKGPVGREVASFKNLFKLTRDGKNWAEHDEEFLPYSTSWEQSVNSIKQLRDGLDHPKFDGYNLSPLFILGDCSGSIEYAQFLVNTSLRIRKIFQSRHVELKQLIVEVLGTLKSIDVREGETFRMLDFGDQPEGLNEVILKSMPDDGTISLVSYFGIPEGMKIL